MSLHPRLALVLILLVTFGLYAKTLGNEFCYDDNHYVQVPSDSGNRPNHMVATWQGITKYYTTFYGDGGVEGGRGLRPVTVMSFWLGQQIGGMPEPGTSRTAGPAARVQHAMNVLLHVLTTFVVYLVLRQLFAAWPAVMATGVFALHAIRSDPVISIVGRAEILATLFGCLGLLGYVRGLGGRGAARLAWLAATAFAMFLAYSSKESSLAWIAFAPLFVIAVRWQEDPAAGLLESLRDQWLPWSLCILLPGLAFSALWWPILSQDDFTIGQMNNTLQVASPGERFMTAAAILGYALFQVALPVTLHADYSYSVFSHVESVLEPRFLASITVLLALLVAGVAVARRFPALFLAAATFFGFSFMTSNIPTAIETIYGERLLYTPALALSFLVGWIATRWGGLNKVLLTLLAIWALVNSGVVVMRCLVWQDNPTLFQHESETQPRSVRMQMAAGHHFRLTGERVGYHTPQGTQMFNRWKHYLDRAVEADPLHSHPEPLNDMAYLYIRAHDLYLQGRQPERAKMQLALAEQCIEKALGSPWFTKRHGANLYRHYAGIAQRRGEVEAELGYREKAVAADERNPNTYVELAEFLASHERDPDRVRQLLLDVVRIAPDSLPLRGQAIEIADRIGDRQLYQRLLDGGDPTDPYMMIYGAILKSRDGNAQEALARYDLVKDRFTPQVPLPQQMHVELGRSLARLGRKDEAITLLRRHLQHPWLRADVRAQVERLLAELQE